MSSQPLLLSEQLQKLEQSFTQRTNMGELEELKDKMIGLRLYVKCHNRSYIGTLKHYFRESKRIWLEKAFIVPSGVPITSILPLLNGAIRSITVVGVDEAAKRKIAKKRAKQIQKAQKLKMAQLANQEESDDEERELEIPEIVLPRPYGNCQRPTKEIIANNSDKLEYYFSVISEENMLSIVYHGFHVDRSGSVAWISIAGRRAVYYFNVLEIGLEVLLDHGLRFILINPHIEKIFHDGRCLIDLLKNCHKIDLENVFDTQATDVYMKFKSSKKVPMITRDFKDICMDYLKLDEPFDCSSFSEDDPSVWVEQPLPNRMFKCMFASVVLMRELRAAMLDIILEGLHESSKKFLNAIADHDPDGPAPKVELAIVPETVHKYLKSSRNCV